MHDLAANFRKFFSITKTVLSDQLDTSGNLQKYSRKPATCDAEVIALSLLCEALGIDSENYLWSKLKVDYGEDFPTLCHRTNFNRRRKRLSNFIHLITERLSKRFHDQERYFIVDSIPIPICNIARERRSRICRKDYHTSPDKGYTASLGKWFFGYKLQLLTTIDGVYKAMELTKASIHDLHYLDEIKNQLENEYSVLIADRGYLSAPKQLELFEERKIILSTPMRRGQRNYTVYPSLYKKRRKRIETLFSQLCDQMMLKRNYAKSFEGVRARIICKISAVTSLQWLNFLNHKPINHLKHALAC